MTIRSGDVYRCNPTPDPLFPPMHKLNKRISQKNFFNHFCMCTYMIFLILFFSPCIFTVAIFDLFKTPMMDNSIVLQICIECVIFNMCSISNMLYSDNLLMSYIMIISGIMFYASITPCNSDNIPGLYLGPKAA